MSTLTHRKVSAGDGPLIAKFFIENVDETYITASEVIWGRATLEGSWAPNLFDIVRDEIEASVQDATKIVVLFFLDNEIAGYTFSALKPGNAVEVEDVVLDRSLRGQGIGRQINAITVKYLQDAGCATMFMEVSSNNARMHDFVKKDGMSPTSIRYWKSI